jgi:hypothetical protein
VLMKIHVLGMYSPCRLVNTCLRFEGTAILRNVGNELPIEIA